ncbi:hypothetical protein BD560DRAFT_454367 [Blakeslea trispora]|nr:hypothetical protein BD560DRAFT_454367 [Blakeslea trispora]
MDTILEKQRSAHEDIERLEQAIVDQYMQDAKVHRERLHNEHVIDTFLTRISEKSAYLAELYQDKDGLRQTEMEALSTSEFSEFYERLKVVKEHHRKYPNEPVDPPELEFIYLAQKKEETDYEELEKMFSGEESTGRYLDLIELHTTYVNLKGVKKLDYLQYLAEFDQFDTNYPKTIKTTEEYRDYLTRLKEYLHGFFRRAKPLFDLQSTTQEAIEQFEIDWQQGHVKGWTEEVKQDLFCVACQKQFTKQTVYDAHLTAKKHLKAQKKLEEMGQIKEDKRKTIALDERLVMAYAEALNDLEQEQEQVELIDQESEDEDDEKIYNPLKLPLGWDGKPIPYWLYKLHGLGVEYPCEICGNYVYMGRKAFDKHFQEWRHAHGMRCLGIPNTRQFHEITKIDDAYALYEKQKREGIAEEMKADTVEEFEDAEGNVYNKKTYEDLKRQGIL